MKTSIKLKCATDPSDYLEVGAPADGKIFIEIYNVDEYLDSEKAIVNLSDENVIRLRDILNDYLTNKL